MHLGVKFALSKEIGKEGVAQISMKQSVIKCREWFSLDLRSLALFRIATAVFLLFDLLERSTNLIAFYCDQGVLPRALLPSVTRSGYWSFHALNGSLTFEAILFALNGLALIALLLGFKTRLATILSWVFLVSLNNRNPMILQAGETFMMLGLFWGIFLPLGARFSIDSPSSSPKRIFNPATVAFCGQVVLVYLLTAYFKLCHQEWRDGTAVYYSLSLYEFTTPIGLWLREHDLLTRISTGGTAWFEIIGPALLFSPIWTGPIRLLAVVLFWCLHIGLGLCLDLGSFPWISCIMMIPFLPSWFWTRIGVGQKIFPSPPEASSSFEVKEGWQRGMLNLLVIFLALLSLAGNFSSLNPRHRLPRLVSYGCGLFRLQQNWGMFAALSKETGWEVVPGMLADGRKIDLWAQTPGTALSWERPALISRTYYDWRWRKLMMSTHGNQFSMLLPQIGRYLAYKYTKCEPNAPPIESISIIWMKEQVLPNHQTTAAVPTVLWQGKLSEMQ